MAENLENSVGDANNGWVRQPYGCTITGSYTSYKEQLLEILLASKMNEDKDGIDASKPDIAKTEEGVKELTDLGALVDSIKAQQPKSNTNLDAGLVDLPMVSDSSIFGNEAINPYSGFCRDDDIVHSAYSSTIGDHTFQMGRVYREIYDSKQQVVYMQFGVPKYRNLFHFIMNASSSQLSDINDQGDTSLISKIANFFIDGTKLAVACVAWPIEFCHKIYSGINDVRLTEYFYFREQMFMYWNHVNMILIHLASGIGLYNNSDGATSEMDKLRPKLPKVLRGGGDKPGGPDIYTVLACRNKRYGSTKKIAEEISGGGMVQDLEKEDSEKVMDTSKLNATNVKTFYEKLGGDNTDSSVTTSAAADKLNKEAAGMYQGFWSQTFGEIKDILAKMWNGYDASASDNTKWLAFRLEKDSDNASESFSNSLSQSSLQEELNGFAATNRSNNLDASTAGFGVLGWINRQSKRISTWANTLNSIITSDKGAGAISSILSFAMSGNGYYDLPQQWSGSSFSRSCNINVRLRSRTGGDPVSVYTNVLIPFACLLAGACPRANGDTTYTSPYIVRAYCRGMFAISAGMITNLSVTRGDSEFGWSIHRLPTTIALQLQITDLSPILFIGLSGSSAGPLELFSLFKNAFLNNTKMHDYLDTLTGMGLKQRIYWSNNAGRNLKIAWRIAASHWANPTYWGMLAADTWMSRTIMALRRAGSMNVPSN